MKTARGFKKGQKLIVTDIFSKRFYCFYEGQDRLKQQLSGLTAK